MVVGFTGTQEGMTKAQIKTVLSLLKMLRPIKAHHGDCEGADAEFHMLCCELRIPITVHPPDNDRKRAFCKRYAEIREPLPYLERNNNIARACDLLIATPKEFDEQLRGSGTWATVRRGRKFKRVVSIVMPNGLIQLEVRK